MPFAARAGRKLGRVRRGKTLAIRSKNRGKSCVFSQRSLPFPLTPTAGNTYRRFAQRLVSLPTQLHSLTKMSVSVFANSHHGLRSAASPRCVLVQSFDKS